jgi:hypothetical protein
MDFREYTVRREGHEIVIMGTIHEPVHWDFSIRMCEDDLAGVAQVTRQKTMLLWLLRAVFKRRRHGHWSQDRVEHLAEAARRRLAAKEKFLPAAQPTGMAPGGSILDETSPANGR